MAQGVLATLHQFRCITADCDARNVPRDYLTVSVRIKFILLFGFCFLLHLHESLHLIVCELVSGDLQLIVSDRCMLEVEGSSMLLVGCP